MIIEKITTTPMGDVNIWVASKTCKSELTPGETWDTWRNNEVPEERISKMLLALWRAKHYSVFEHTSITFGISGISRSCLAQLTRHRHLSFSVQSQRYVDMSKCNIVTPKSIIDNPEAVKIFKNITNEIHEAYKELVNLRIPREDARFILPEGSMTNLVLSCNLRSLGELYEKRVSTSGAQWEITELVDRMADIACEEYPWYRDCLNML
jgi:thymidylate synthase (FAD)